MRDEEQVLPRVMQIKTFSMIGGMPPNPSRKAPFLGLGISITLRTVMRKMPRFLRITA